MSSYLLAVSIGPVQEFIAAARRTRDLWFGSNLLSEISKATAKSIQLQGGELIFPAPEGLADLELGSDLKVANAILAELRDLDPTTVASEAKKAARDRWMHEAGNVLDRYRQYVSHDIWNAQVNDAIEFYAAWMPLGDDYKQARRRVMRLLDGRKHGKDFVPAGRREPERIPKSSLDGLRESVLKPSKEWPEQTWRTLRLQEGEQLDVVGLVKRTAGGKQSYPSVARVAADPWISGLVEVHGKDVFSPLREACEMLGRDKIHRLDVTERGQSRYAVFPFEGTVVYRSWHRELKEEAEIKDEFEPLANRLADLTKLAGEPSPYLAVLIADGDRMGQALSKLKKVEDHRAFSRALSHFAGDARDIVNQHSGVLVYAGGDDVLAFLPADLALRCARRLHDKFAALMKTWAEKTEERPTLSVGLAFAHFMDNLEDLLEYGRAAEQHAKKPRSGELGQIERDGLAVHVIKRGGGSVEMRENWTEMPDQRLDHIARLLNSGAIPAKVAYDLHRVAQVYDRWPSETVEAAIQRDAIRIIVAKQPRESSGLEAVKKPLESVSDAHSLRRLADEILVARQIAVAIRQGTGREPATEVDS